MYVCYWTSWLSTATIHEQLSTKLAYLGGHPLVIYNAMIHDAIKFDCKHDTVEESTYKT